MALLLNRFALEEQYDAQLQDGAAKKTLDTRIAVNRAVQIVARLRGIPEKEALALLIQHARRSRCRLMSAADAILHGNTSFRKAAFQLVQRKEPAMK